MLAGLGRKSFLDKALCTGLNHVTHLDLFQCVTADGSKDIAGLCTGGSRGRLLEVRGEGASGE